MKDSKRVWSVKNSEDGIKLIEFIYDKLEAKHSKKSIKRLIDQGLCSINGQIECFSNTRLISKNKVCFQLPEKSSTETISILYEDKDFLAIDKPCDVVSDQQLASTFGKNYQLIHRLDKMTSGILLIAKNQAFKNLMIKLFSKKAVEKTYYAVVDGNVKTKGGAIENFLIKKRAPEGQTLWKGSKNPKGIIAITEYETLKHGPSYSVLRLHPITGRMHQLRVHCCDMGHPVLGDFLYAKHFQYTGLVSRLMLHAYSISFKHPKTDKKITIKATLPESFAAFI